MFIFIVFLFVLSIYSFLVAKVNEYDAVVYSACASASIVSVILGMILLSLFI